MKKYYSLYKGDNEIAFGSLEEIAKKQNIHIDSLEYLMTQAHRNKMNKRSNKGKNAKVLILVK